MERDNNGKKGNHDIEHIQRDGEKMHWKKSRHLAKFHNRAMSTTTNKAIKVGHVNTKQLSTITVE